MSFSLVSLVVSKHFHGKIQLRSIFDEGCGWAFFSYVPSENNLKTYHLFNIKNLITVLNLKKTDDKKERVLQS